MYLKILKDTVQQNLIHRLADPRFAMLVNCVLGKLIVITGSRKLHRDSQSYCESVIEGYRVTSKSRHLISFAAGPLGHRGAPATEQTRETFVWESSYNDKRL